MPASLVILALFIGLTISAGLYFAFVWPRIEPREASDPDRAPEEPGE